MTSYQEIQNQLVKKAQEMGSRTAQLPQAPNTANDPTINALRGQHSDKLSQLFKYDTERAQVKYNPGEAPGPHAEGYTPPTDRIIDPLIGARASSQQTMATANELGDIVRQISQRKDLLQDSYQKGLDVYNAGIEAQKLEFQALNQIFGNALDISKHKSSSSGSGQTAQEWLNNHKYKKGTTTSSKTAEVDRGGPQYSPTNPYQVVFHNNAVWSWDKQSGMWKKVTVEIPSYFVPD